MSTQKSKSNVKKIIWLVITIIVIVAIAIGAIVIINKNKPINQVQEAKDEAKIATDKREALSKVQVQLIAINDEEGNIDINKLNENLSKINGIDSRYNINELPAIIIVDGYKIKIDQNLEVTLVNEEEKDATLQIGVGEVAKENSTINGLEKGYDNPIIPKGFKAIDTQTAIWTDTNGYRNGLVIEDATGDKTTNGSQFVWIPVKNYEDFHLIEGYTDNGLAKMLSEGVNSCREAGSDNNEALPGKPHKVNNIIGTNESTEMYKSVKENGGFYIGRYEAGILDETKKDIQDGSIKPVSKKQTVWNYISWGGDVKIEATDNMSGNDNSNGAVKVARSMYNNPITGNSNKNTTVKSTLCYGVQWDAVLNFIDENYVKGEATGYIKDSTGKGNYSSKVELTGSNDGYMVNNIYDLAGNVREWTMEAYQRQYRVMRGGNYKGMAHIAPASSRYINEPSERSNTIGFRVALYL